MVCGSAQYVPQHGISSVISKTSAFPSYSSLPWLPFYSTVVSVISCRRYHLLLDISLMHLHLAFSKFAVLFFFYLLYELGICKCICWTSCKIVWGCISVYVSVWEYCCYFLFDKLRHVKRISRRRRRRDVEGQYYASSSDEVEEESSSSTCNDEVSRIEKKRRHRRDYKRDHVTRSLRPRSHRVRVGVSENSGYITRNNSSKHWDDQGSSVHSIRVAQTSKFARKGSSFKGSKHRKRR